MKERLKKFSEQYLKKNNLIVMALLGLLLMVIVLPFEDAKKQESAETEQPAMASANASGLEASTGEEYEAAYRQRLEEELQELLESMDGVGKVRVMITLSATSERVILKDYEISEEEDSMRTVENTVFYTDEEGVENPYCQKIITPSIEGVVVVAQGGGDPQRIIEITDVIQSLFDVPIHKIRVVRMKSE